MSTTVAGALEAAPLSQCPMQPQDVAVLESYRTYGETWNLFLNVQRTVDAETLAAVIDWLDLETLLRRDGSRLTRGRLRMQNKTLQFLPVQLPAGARLLSLFVAGEASKANRASMDGIETLLFPLIKTAPGDLSFEIEFSYEEPGEGSLDRWQRPRLEGPRVRKIPVGQTFWTFHVPEELNLYRPRGNMQETARFLTQSEKLVAKQQELQRLKQVVVGAYQLSSQKRAVENYEQLEGEIRQQQSQYNEAMLRQEVLSNRRLAGEYKSLAGELSANDLKLRQGMQADRDGEWRKKVAELEQQPAPAAQQAGAWEAEGRVRWKSRTATPTAGGREYLPEYGLQSRGDVVQMGRNVYLRQLQKSAKGTSAEVGQREDTSAFSNLSQAPAQRAYAEKNIEDFNQVIAERLGKQAMPPSRTAPATDLPAARAVRVQPPSLVPAAMEGPPPAAPQQLGEVSEEQMETRGQAEARARVQGAYSIAVPFPMAGQSYTFKKMKGDPQVAFTLLHRQVPGKAVGLLKWALAAALFWLLLRALAHPTTHAHLIRYAYLYAGGAVLVVLVLNVLLGAALAVVYGVCLYVYVARRRLRGATRPR